MTAVDLTDLSRIDWAKGDGLLPAIVQHERSGEVLMLGYMNAQALDQTCRSGWVTFFSRSRQRLWTKGESSGHRLVPGSIRVDCDADTLLIQAKPQGPTCHTGLFSCFGSRDALGLPIGFLAELDDLIQTRQTTLPSDSYVTQLFKSGLQRMAQKVGEEGVETALAAMVQDDHAFLGEAADLLFHLLVLLRARGLSLLDITRLLAQRHQKG